MATTTLANVLLIAPELTDFTENIAQVNTITVTTVVDDTDYTLYINDSLFTFNSGAGATAISIAAGLHAAVELGSEPVTSVDNLDGTFKLTADVAGDLFEIVLDAKLTSSLDTENWGGLNLFNMILADVQHEVTLAKYKNEQERAQRYLVAHYLTVAKALKESGGAALAAGDISRQRVGDIEIEYSEGSSDDSSESSYAATKYGEIFIDIRKRYSLRFI